MDKMGLLISVAGLIMVPTLAYTAFRGTILDLMYLRRNPWPLLWYKSVCLTLLPLVLVSAWGVEGVPILFAAAPGTEGPVALLVVVTLLTYIVCLSMFLRAFGLSLRKCIPTSEPRLHAGHAQLATACALLGLALLVLFHALGYRHAFLTAIVQGESLLRIRLANAYNSRVPSQLASMLLLLGYLVAALGGYLGRTKHKQSLFCLVVALLVLSARGDKAPPIMGLLIWLLAQGSIVPRRLSSRRMPLFLLVAVGGVLGAACLVVSLQVPGLTLAGFAEYLVNRLGVGQMAGVYETFGLAHKGALPQVAFHWHMIPGARLFVDYLDYQKVLMMVTEGYSYSEMGVKNTYFVAEAFAIAGLPLALVSPVIVAASTALGLYVLEIVMRQIVGRDLSGALAVLVYLRTHDITGGFSSFPFLKGLILTIAQLCLILLASLVVARAVRLGSTLLRIGPRRAYKVCGHDPA